MRKLITICAVVGILVISGTAMATTTTVITTLSSGSHVAGKWYQNGTTSGGSASIVSLTGLGGNLENGQPLPTGAAELTTNMTNSAKAEIGTFGDFGLASTALNDIVLGYNYYRQNLSGGNTFAAPSIKLEIKATGGSGDLDGYLVYEPYWNGSITSNIWQSVSINSSTGAGGILLVVGGGTADLILPAAQVAPLFVLFQNGLPHFRHQMQLTLPMHI